MNSFLICMWSRALNNRVYYLRIAKDEKAMYNIPNVLLKDKSKYICNDYIYLFTAKIKLNDNTIAIRTKNNMYISLVLVIAIICWFTRRLRHALRAVQIFLFFFPLLFSLFLVRPPAPKNCQWRQRFCAGGLFYVFARRLAYFLTSLQALLPTFLRLCI